MSKINARSPYYINISATNLTQVDNNFTYILVLKMMQRIEVLVYFLI